MKNLILITALSLFTATTLAAPVPSDSLQIAAELEARTPIVGMLFRGAGRAAKKLPDKAGKKMAKNQGPQKETPAEKKRIDQMADRWSKYLGKPQDRNCVKGWHNTFSRNGGFNAVINCDKRSGKKKGGYINIWGKNPGKQRRELVEGEVEGRELLFNDELEERAFIEYLLEELD